MAVKRNISLVDTVISVIVVTQNDKDIIQQRLKEIKKAISRLKTPFEIIVVDKNSQDETIEKIKKDKKLIESTRILILSKEYNTEIALTAGLDNCIGDYAVLFNIYMDPVDMLPKIIEKLAQGKDVIIAKPKKFIIELGILTRALLYSIEKISRQGFYYGFGYLIGLNRKAINSITRIRRKSRNISYINALIGLKKDVIFYQPLKKFKKKIKRENFITILINIIDAIISNSFKPMRIISLLGIALSVLFLIWILGVVILAFVFGRRDIVPQGWISVATIIGTLFFLLFLLLSVTSEYIIRILNEARDEPIYFISEEIDKSTILPKRTRVNVV